MLQLAQTGQMFGKHLSQRVRRKLTSLYPAYCLAGVWQLKNNNNEI